MIDQPEPEFPFPVPLDCVCNFQRPLKGPLDKLKDALPTLCKDVLTLVMHYLPSIFFPVLHVFNPKVGVWEVIASRGEMIQRELVYNTYATVDISGDDARSSTEDFLIVSSQHQSVLRLRISFAQRPHSYSFDVGASEYQFGFLIL